MFRIPVSEHLKNILLLGYGEMGHAMEDLLLPQHAVKIWDPYFQGDLLKIDLEETLKQTYTVIFCTPTAPIYKLAQRISQSLPKDCLCLSMAKALDEESRTAPEALQQGLAGQTAFAVLYGPMIAEEMLARRLAFACASASDETALSRTINLFQGTQLKLTPYDDMQGAAWCAVLKNVYAMLFGMADELAMGDNMRGFLAVVALGEMSTIVQSLNGLEKTPYTLAGLGDLFTTATSENSHHHELGRMVARNEREHLEGEGMNTLNMIAKHQRIEMGRYPILLTVWEIMYESKDPADSINKLFDRIRD